MHSPNYPDIFTFLQVEGIDAAAMAQNATEEGSVIQVDVGKVFLWKGGGMAVVGQTRQVGVAVAVAANQAQIPSRASAMS